MPPTLMQQIALKRLKFFEQHNIIFPASNSSVTVEMIEYLLDQGAQLSWSLVCGNPNITFEFIMKHMDRLPKVPPGGFNICWNRLSMHQNISMQHVNSHPTFPWNWYYMSKNPNIRFEDVLNHLDQPWDWFQLSCHRNISMDHVLEHPHLPWKLATLAHNKNIGINEYLRYVTQHPQHHQQQWNWVNFCSNPNLDIEDIIKYCPPQWIKWYLTENPNVTPEHVFKYPHLFENHRALCKNPSFGIEYVLEQEWWKVYSCNPNLRYEEVIANIDKPWDWYAISKHPNITYEQVLTLWEIIQNSMLHDDAWIANLFIAGLCSNPTLMYPTQSEIREWWASKTICRILFECFVCPKYEKCKRRLLKEYDELCTS